MTDEAKRKLRDDINNHLNPDQARALLLFAKGKKKGEIAKEIGVNRRTLYTWMQKRTFRDLLERARSVLFDDMFDCSLTDSGEMINILKEVARGNVFQLKDNLFGFEENGRENEDDNKDDDENDTTPLRLLVTPRDRVAAASKVVDVSVKARQLSIEQEMELLREELDHVVGQLERIAESD